MDLGKEDNTQPYNKDFYKHKEGWTHVSADLITKELLKLITLKSVVDVGCGTGTWLESFKKHGVHDIFGIDGDYVTPDMLEIPLENFMAFDLKKPLNLTRNFDLAISLEVAEHLPESHAPDFVRGLTQIAPIVLFSAAIPHQGGVNHINEQWQEYWCKLFIDNDFSPIDIIRKNIWGNDNIADHYKQNIMLYIDNTYIDKDIIINAASETDMSLINAVHPERYLKLINRINGLKNQKKRAEQEIKDIQNPMNMSLYRHLVILPILIKNALLNLFNKAFN